MFGTYIAVATLAVTATAEANTLPHRNGSVVYGDAIGAIGSPQDQRSLDTGYGAFTDAASRDRVLQPGFSIAPAIGYEATPESPGVGVSAGSGSTLAVWRGAGATQGDSAGVAGLGSSFPRSTPNSLNAVGVFAESRTEGQGFGAWTGGESMTWVLLTIGFGALGATLRFRGGLAVV